jgi:hypothetical protein
MHTRLVSIGMLALLVGCDPGPPPGPVTVDQGTRPPPSYLDGGAPLYWDTGSQQDGQSAPGSDATVSTSCPKVDGTFEGTLKGKITGFFNMTVTGTLWMTIKPSGQAGNYKVTDGEMASWAVGFKAFTFKQKLFGDVTCGVLSGAGEADIMGVKSKGTTKCTFNEAGTTCTGTWKGTSTDGKSGGSGTFVVTRKTS